MRQRQSGKGEWGSPEFQPHFATFSRAGSGQWGGGGRGGAGLQLTWHVGAPGHPDGSCGSTASGGHRCRAGKPTPSWGRWPAPGEVSSPPSGNNIASPTGASCQHQRAWGCGEQGEVRENSQPRVGALLVNGMLHTLQRCASPTLRPMTVTEELRKTRMPGPRPLPMRSECLGK